MMMLRSPRSRVQARAVGRDVMEMKGPFYTPLARCDGAADGWDLAAARGRLQTNP